MKVEVMVTIQIKKKMIKKLCIYILTIILLSDMILIQFTFIYHITISYDITIIYLHILTTWKHRLKLSIKYSYPPALLMNVSWPYVMPRNVRRFPLDLLHPSH